MARLTDCPDMTLDVYRGRKTTIQQQQSETPISVLACVRFHWQPLHILFVPLLHRIYILKQRHNFLYTNLLVPIEILLHTQNLNRSGGSAVRNTLDYQSRGRKIDPPLLRS